MQQPALAERAEFGDESALSFHTSGRRVQVEEARSNLRLARFGHFLQLRGHVSSQQEMTPALHREYMEGVQARADTLLVAAGARCMSNGEVAYAIGRPLTRPCLVGRAGAACALPGEARESALRVAPAR